ncbi:DUF1707 SHOCT-like domain-containing protein [Jiangella muralis]|uniref:DUF1707 SHOCT-like domain-containing protein n=1 Tax=Jiangella muralis TaxID=702383 RepID=UPI00069E32F9|nr:DUF1707 domain-containing protein [Jiangella muralis]
MGDDVARREDGAGSLALERVSDADRERAAEFVQAALGDGRIGLDEIDERLGAVLAARTRGDLEAALVHLPGADAVLTTAGSVAPAPRPAGEPATINGTHARMQRTGRWEVPAHLVVTLVHSSLVLDLTEAALPGPELRVDADLTHSRLRLIVPDDIRVEATDLEEHGSKVRVEPAHSATPPRAVVRVTGRLQWSRVAAVAPGRRRRRELRRS